jgi:restriction endonuclease Mrr
MGNDLPSESEVIRALKEYLGNQTRPVSPSEAYHALANKFGLSYEQRNRLMPNRDEVHWENRVRQARRKLNNESLLDRSVPLGRWAIKKA